MPVWLVFAIVLCLVHSQGPGDVNGVEYVSVTRDGGNSWQVPHNHSTGFADHRYKIPLSTAASQFRIASNSKFFTALAIYQLQDRGLLNVSVPVTKLLNATDYAKFDSMYTEVYNDLNSSGHL